MDHFCRHQGSLRRHSGIPQRQYADLPSNSVFSRTARSAKARKVLRRFSWRLDAGCPKGDSDLGPRLLGSNFVRRTGPNKNKYIVHTWHRTARVEEEKIIKVVYGHSYPAYPPAREDPQPEEFYRALLAFAEYWDEQLHDIAPASLPQNAWVDMSKHSFAKELMTRPGGIYPKYGAVDRDYGGSEYDGFQDIFTSAIYTNIEWGRLETARLFIDNYFTEYVDSKGMIDMRGPETAQFGMTLSLLARYFHYSGDHALILRHRLKIEATAKLLEEMHDESLQLPPRKCRLWTDLRME